MGGAWGRGYELYSKKDKRNYYCTYSKKYTTKQVVGVGNSIHSIGSALHATISMGGHWADEVHSVMY